MTLEEWDKRIGPVLSKMRLDAGWIIHYAKSVNTSAANLEGKPEWTTEAEEVLTQARDEVMAATLLLNGALNHLKIKEKLK